jgi:hypothetical protein
MLLEGSLGWLCTWASCSPWELGIASFSNGASSYSSRPKLATPHGSRFFILVAFGVAIEKQPRIAATPLASLWFPAHGMQCNRPLSLDATNGIVGGEKRSDEVPKPGHNDAEQRDVLLYRAGAVSDRSIGEWHAELFIAVFASHAFFYGGDPRGLRPDVHC